VTLQALEALEFYNTEDQNILDILIERISNGECAVFIGSGLSMDVGYPDLQRMLREMAAEAGLEDLHKKAISDDWMDDFQIIKEALGIESYRDHLRDFFDHNTKSQQFNHILINLLNIPFCAYITTNYDPCVEFASRYAASSPKSTNSYPNLPITELRNEHIFHVHGYVNPDDQSSVKTIVLARDEYEDAYNNSGIVSQFLSTLFSEIDVVFIGFGWNDLVIIETISKAKETREIREEFAAQRGFGLTRARSVFAIIDSEIIERDKQGNNYLGENGVIPIVYEKTSGSHNKLNYLVQEIQKKTSSIPIAPMPSPPADIIGFGDNDE